MCVSVWVTHARDFINKEAKLGQFVEEVAVFKTL